MTRKRKFDNSIPGALANLPIAQQRCFPAVQEAWAHARQRPRGPALLRGRGASVHKGVSPGWCSRCTSISILASERLLPCIGTLILPIPLTADICDLHGTRIYRICSFYIVSLLYPFWGMSKVQHSTSLCKQHCYATSSQQSAVISNAGLVGHGPAKDACGMTCLIFQKPPCPPPLSQT